MDRYRWLIVLMVSAGSVVLAQTEFLVNVVQDSTQRAPRVAAAASGEYAVVWTSWNLAGNGSGRDIALRRFAPDNTPLGVESAVNTTGQGDQEQPALAVNPTGTMVIAWRSLGATDTMYDIRARVYRDGIPAGDEFVVNTTRRFSQSNPQVALDSAGNSVIVWDSWFQDGSDRGVYGQRFDASGSRVGSEFCLSTTTAYSQAKPVVSYLSSDRFVTAWESWGQDLPGQAGYAVIARLWNADGTPASPEIPVNVFTSDYQWYAAVAALGYTRFAIAWCSWSQDGDGGGIYARIFDRDGQPQTGELPVTLTTAYYQWLPRVTRLGDDRFAVAWSSWKQDGSREGVYLRTFATGGRPLSLEEQVNAYTDSFQWEPDIAEGSGGDCIVVWSTWGVVGKDYDIAARRLSPPVPEGTLRQTVVQHPYWRSTTRLSLHVYDSTALNGHTYEVVFDSLGGRSASVTVRDLVGADTVVTAYPIDRGENVFYLTPVFDGLALEIVPEFDLDLDFRGSYFSNHSGSNLSFVLAYPSAGIRKIAPIDLALVWGSTDTLSSGLYAAPLDTALNTAGSRVVAVPFLAWNLTDNQKCDLLVVDSRANRRWDPDEKIVFRTPAVYRSATNNTCAELDPILPPGGLQLPVPGDSNFVLSTRPIREGELYRFTAAGSEVVDVGPRLPEEFSFSLARNYPNPFNPCTAIRYTIPSAGRVTLSVYNLLGQRVAILVDEMEGAGSYRVAFDGRPYASGVYFCRLEHSGRSVVQKMLMLK